LDTSALLAIPKARLATLGQAFTSPFCFYELLCHLDEDEFRRRKGNVLKCAETSILDDPEAEFASHFGIDPRPRSEQVEAGEIIRTILDRLTQSETLDEFYSQHVPDEQGNLRLVRDCARVMRNVLDTEAEKYKRFVESVIGVIQTGLIDLKSPESCNNAIMGLVKGHHVDLKNRGVTGADLHEVDDRKYLHAAYVFERAVIYFERGAKIDKNDYEDASILKHMRLTTPTVFVTNDGKTIDAVRAALYRLRKLGFGTDDGYELDSSRIVKASEL
jgi:hypothetical protein